MSQKAALPVRNAFDAAPSSTFALTRPDLFHVSTLAVFLRNAAFRRPMSDGSRFPARFFPKT